jgi:hypothetical protein
MPDNSLDPFKCRNKLKLEVQRRLTLTAKTEGKKQLKLR